MPTWKLTGHKTKDRNIEGTKGARRNSPLSGNPRSWDAFISMDPHTDGGEVLGDLLRAVLRLVMFTTIFLTGLGVRFGGTIQLIISLGALLTIWVIETYAMGAEAI